MKRALACVAVVAVTCACLANIAVSVSSGDQTAKDMLGSIDDSIAAVRKGEITSAKQELSRARGQYGKFQENVDNALDNKIRYSFGFLPGQLDDGKVSKGEKESNLRDLRAKLSLAADKVGIGLSPVYRYAALVVLMISIIFAAAVTLLCKYTIDWPGMRRTRAEMKRLREEMRKIHPKKKFKLVQELEARLDKLSKQMPEGATEKQVIFLLIPYFLLWWLLDWVYGGWVIAWVPSGLTLPIVGWTYCGSLAWLVITYFGSVVLLRQMLIRGG